MITPYIPAHRHNMTALMTEASRHSVPTREEENALVKAAKRGNTQATHALILGNLRFVIKMANSLSHNAELAEELTAAGISGMMDALKNYCQQSSRGGRFIHYAAFHIRRQMRHALNDYRNPVTANPNNYDIARKIFAYEENVLNNEERRATNAEIGKKFGLTANRVERMKKLMERPMYLDHALGGEDERNGHDVCADNASLLPSLATENRMEAELLKDLMRKHLNEREIIVLEQRFGMGGNIENGTEENDLRAIGKLCNISRERVRQIEVEALKKMRFHLSQVCPLYRQRARNAMGINAAIIPSKLTVRTQEKEVLGQPVAVRHNSKLRMVHIQRRELVAAAA